MDAKLLSNSSLEDIQRHAFNPDRALTDQRNDSIQTQLGELLALLWLFMKAWERSYKNKSDSLAATQLTSSNSECMVTHTSCVTGGPNLINLSLLSYCPFPSAMPGPPAEAGLCAAGGSKWLEFKVRIY